MPVRFIKALVTSVCLLASALAEPTLAQSYPDKPITVIVPSSAGGPADVAIRLINEKLSSVLGQSIIIETVAGAGGTIGMARVARAAPDGYTLLIHQTGFAITPGIYDKLPFDTEKDFVTIGMVNHSASLLCGRADHPAKTYAELEAWIKANPQSVKYAHPGPGTSGHLITTMHMKLMGVDIRPISYRGIAPAVNDMLGGHIDIASVSAAVATPLVKSGKLKAFATQGATRNPDLPDVPTFAEVGHKQLQQTLWHALFAPAATPRPILEKLNAALRTTLKDAKVLERYRASSVDVHPEDMLTLEASHAFVKAEIALWGKVIRDNNVKVDPAN